jgi:hypothetical protein
LLPMNDSDVKEFVVMLEANIDDSESEEESWWIWQQFL